MSNRWWNAPPLSGSTGLISRLWTGAEPRDPPATLLRIPPWIQAEEAGADIATADPTADQRSPVADETPPIADRRPLPVEPRAGRRECRSAGFAIGTPVSRYGTVKLWRARTVNLRLLLFMAGQPGEAPALETPAAPARPARRPGSGEWEARPSKDDELIRRLSLLLQPPPEMLLTVTGPLEWPGALFPYQRDGIRALLQSPHLLLGDDMGLGKTVEAIAALRLLLHRREIERALVVAPASLLEQWRRELLLWAPELRVMVIHGSPEDRAWRWQYRAHVSLTSYETLRSDATGGSSGPAREKWGVVILDEAQRIKNRDTDLARACKRLPRERSWALTGTPLENRPEDVLSILEFVTDGARGGVRVTAGVSLRAMLGQYQLRRRKADVLADLPPKVVSDLVLPLTPAQRRAYDRAEQEGLVALRERGDIRIENVLALLTRLKQICNFAPAGEASAKMDDLEARLEELTATGQKALVFTQFAGEESGARRIARRLQRFAPLLYTGDMSPRERHQTIQRFHEIDDHRALILSLQAGGQGLNLQRASYVFHFDRSWNPAIEQQAESRSHRLGQTQPVNVYRYVMADTIEERIAALLKQKSYLFEEIVDGSSLDPAKLLDQRALFELVGLEPPARTRADPTGAALEARVARLLVRQGYRVEPTGGRGDGGVDLIAQKQDAVGGRPRLWIQCKDTAEPAGVEVIRSLSGALPPGDRTVTGVVACPAGFTAEARHLAALRQIQLWDAARLEELGRGT